MIITLSFMGMSAPLALSDDFENKNEEVAAKTSEQIGSVPPADTVNAEDGETSTGSSRETRTGMAKGEAATSSPTATVRHEAENDKASEAEQAHDAGAASSNRNSAAGDQKAEPQDEPLNRSEDSVPLAMAPMAVGPVNIGQISARIANHRNSAGNTPGGDCFRYAPVNVGGNNKINSSGPTEWVSNSAEARGSHGTKTNGANCTTITQSNQTADASTVGIVPSQTSAVTPGTAFLLGAVTHYNNPVYASSEFFKGDLGVRLSGLSGAPEITVPWTLWETPNSPSWFQSCANGGANNQGINVNGCADQITFASQIGDQIITVDGVEYRLVFSGFSPPRTDSCPPTPPAGTQNSFWTAEKRNTKSCFYASLEQVRALTIQKNVQASDVDATSFEFSSTSSLAGSPWDRPTFHLTAGGSTGRQELLQGETVTVTEALPAGWRLDNLRCAYTKSGGQLSSLDASAVNVSGNVLKITRTPANTTANQQDITCTYTNAPSPAVVKLTKAWQNATAGDKVELTVRTSRANTNSAISTAPNGSAAAAQISVQVGENVTLTESFTTGLADDYASTLTCDQGVVPVAGSFTVPSSAKGKTINCTFTNVGLPTLQLVKIVDPGATGDTTPASDWTLTGTNAGTPATVITGAGDTGLKRVPVGSYALAESGPTHGWSASKWSCKNGATTRTGSNLVIKAGENWVCTITNTAKPASVVVTKTWIIDGKTYTVPRTGSMPKLPEGFSSNLTLSGQVSPQWGTTYDAYRLGSMVTIGEGDVIVPKACTNAVSGDLGERPLSKSANTFNVVNTVTCTVKVELIKSWVNGRAGDTTALSINDQKIGEGFNISTATGVDGTETDTAKAASAMVPSGSTVTVAEVLGEHNVGRYAVTGPTCVDGDNKAVAVAVAEGDSAAGSFVAPLRGAVTCTFTNTRLLTDLFVEKYGITQSGTPGPVGGASFEIRLNEEDVPGAEAATVAPVTGQTGRFAAAGFDPGTYWLLETKAPSGHSLLAEPVGFTIDRDGSLTLLGDNPQASIDPAGSLTIRITDVAAIPLPFTGGGAVNFAVLAMVVLGIGAFGIVLIRRQRPQRPLTTG